AEGPGAPRAESEEQPKGDAYERRADEDEPGPAEGLVGGGEDDLRAPLLVLPRHAGGREGPRVDRGEGPRRKDLGSGAEVIGEVDRGQRGDDRRKDGQRDG